MARTRQIYASDMVFVGPTGTFNCTGSHFNNANAGYGNTGALVSGNLIAELYRVQRVGWNATKNLTDINQFGELAAIDRIPLNPPTVTLNIDWILSNLINESIVGLTVAGVGTTANVSCVSGLLAGTTSPKNFFVKGVAEGSDAADNNSASYNVIAFGNGYVSSYTAQGAVGGFPTASITVDCLNVQGDAIASSPVGVPIPAVNQTDGSAITGYWYKLPTGLTSYGDAALTANAGLSALRPGDIVVSLGLADNPVGGDTFYTASDLKAQSFNISYNLNQEDLNKLGSKYAYAKVPRYPVNATLTVSNVVGDFQTGKLTEWINNNTSFNPTVTMYSPGSTSNVIAKFTLANAKLDTQSSDLNIGSNKSLDLSFQTQLGGPQDLTKGVYMSGITVNPA